MTAFFNMYAAVVSFSCTKSRSETEKVRRCPIRERMKSRDITRDRRRKTDDLNEKKEGELFFSSAEFSVRFSKMLCPKRPEKR
jgi:hypothetical protein